MHKRLIALLLTIVTVLSIVSVPVYSSYETGEYDVSQAYSQYSFSSKVDTASLIEYLEKELMSCPERVDVSSFNIPDTPDDASVFQELVWHGTPVLFHVYGIGFMANGGYIKYVYFSYLYEAKEYQRMYDECMVAVAEILSDIKGNSSLSDVTKALLIHDRIIERCEYDYNGVESGKISNESEEMYGALVNGVATCQGYAYSYMYLLREVGIESYVCSSERLQHDWNIVILNGKKYHVDVTFDDPVYDVTGRVYHKYFLLSTSAMKKYDHNASDYDATPNDTKYDSYYWRNVETGFQLIGKELYYVNNANGTLNKVGQNTPVLNIDYAWKAPGGKYWVGNYCRLSSDGVNLFYSGPDSVYIYNPVTHQNNVVYKPNMTGKDTFSIFGFMYDKGYIVCDLYNNPKFERDTEAKYQVRVPYDLEAPTISISYTSSLSAYQTVTLDMRDDMYISGYYIGTDPDYSKNEFVMVNDPIAEAYISNEGRYYFTAKDGAGNVSETVSATFYRIELETMGGTVALSHIILPVGAKLTLPESKRNGYIFKGWTTDLSGGSPISTLTVTGNTTCYALWEETGEESDTPALPVYVNKFIDVSDTAWYADEVAYCVQRGYMNGVSEERFSPNTALTREQFVLILANASGINAGNYKYVDSGMKDVPVGQWYSGAIAWAVNEGYIVGVSEGVFGLRQDITREQLARLFYKYAEKLGMNVEQRADLNGFSDSSKVGSWAKENVSWAVSVGLISGMNDGRLAPRASATRAQAARMFMMFDALK